MTWFILMDWMHLVILLHLVVLGNLVSWMNLMVHLVDCMTGNGWLVYFWRGHRGQRLMHLLLRVASCWLNWKRVVLLKDLVLGHQLITCGQHLVNGLSFWGWVSSWWRWRRRSRVPTEGQLSGCMVRGESSRWRGVIKLDGGWGRRSQRGWRNVFWAGRVGKRAGILTATMYFAWTT